MSRIIFAKQDFVTILYTFGKPVLYNVGTVKNTKFAILNDETFGLTTKHHRDEFSLLGWLVVITI